MLCIYYLSSRVIRIPHIFVFSFRDKVLHLIEYGGLGLLVARAVLLMWPQRPRWRTLGAAVFITTMWGLSDELHQAFVPGRSAETLDLVADFIGASGGALIWHAWHKFRQRDQQAGALERT